MPDPTQDLAMPRHWGIVADLFRRHAPAVVLTSHQRVEEGEITQVDGDGFRIGGLGHWVWWSEIERVGEKKR
jgi:hypothetical protein